MYERKLGSIRSLMSVYRCRYEKVRDWEKGEACVLRMEMLFPSFFLIRQKHRRKSSMITTGTFIKR